MNKLCKFFIFFVLLFLFLLPVTVFADTSDTLREYELEEYMRTQGEGYQKPYTISELGTESIDPYSGGLSLRATDLTLPGKNGMDFVLARSYNNQAGRAYIEYENTTVLREVTYPAAYYNYVKDGVAQSVLVAFESEEELYAAWDSFRMGNNINLNIDAYQQEYLLYHKWMRQDGALVLTRDTTKAVQKVYLNLYRDIKRDPYNTHSEYAINNMWLFDFPGVVERDRVIKDRASDTRYFEYCELSAFDGASYQLVIEYFYDWETHEYGNGSVTVKKSGSAVGTGYEGFCDYPNTNGTNQEGITYSYRVVDAQKNTMYFSKNGLIQAVKDKYGNMIRYFYNGGKISQVVDSMGREINFTWNQNAVTVTVSGTDVSITYGQSVENNPDDPTNYFSVDDEYITTMTKRDKAGTSPVTSTTTYRAKKHYKPYRLDSRGQINEYVLTDVKYDIYEVAYPTGLRATYEFENRGFFLGELLYGDKSLVCARYDRQGTQPAKYNETTYTYEKMHRENSYTFPSSYPSSKWPVTTVTRAADGYETEYRFDKEGRKDYASAGSGANFQKTTYTYQGEKSDKITAETVSFYTGPGRSTNYTYDGHLTASVAYDDYQVNNTYDDTYYQQLTSIYMTDDTHTVKQENTLSADKKHVVSQKTYEKEGAGEYVQKSRTDFAYDEYGNVINQKTYTDETSYTETQTTYTYNNDHSYSVTQSVLGVANADGAGSHNITTTQTYDALGRLVSATDALGSTTTYTYDLSGRVESVTNPDGTQQTVEYHLADNYVIQTDEKGLKTKAQYNAQGNITSVSVNLSGTSFTDLETYTYDSLGRLLTKTQNVSTSPVQKLVSGYEFYPEGKIKKITVTDQTGAVVSQQSYAYDYAASIDGSTASENKKYTKVTINQLGDATITPPAVTRYYNRQGNLEKQQAGNYLTTYTYNKVGAVVSKKEPYLHEKDPDAAYSTLYEYDHAGRVTRQTNALGQYQQTIYDMAGRKIRTINNDETVFVAYSYDKMGRVVKQESAFDANNTTSAKFYYDDNGNTTKTMQQTGGTGDSATYTVTENAYDVRGRVKYVKQSPSETEDIYTQYTYDAAGNVTKLFTGLASPLESPETITSCENQPFALVCYAYDSLGRMTAATDALGQRSTCVYDLSGRVTSATDRNGVTTTTSYSPKGEVLNVSTNVGGLENTISYTYDILGNRKTMTDYTGTTSYTYDSYARLTGVAKGGILNTYGYDAAGNRTSYSLKDGAKALQSASYTYDTIGRLASYSGGGVSESYEYNGQNLLTKITGDLYTTTYTYNKAGLVTNMNNGKSSYYNTYYLDGNMNAFTESNPARGTGYTYDGIGRLVKETISAPSEGLQTYSYTYDRYHNRTGLAFTNSAAPEDNYNASYTYNKNNQLITEAKTQGETVNTKLYTYDPNGNLITRIDREIGPKTQDNSVLSLSGYEYAEINTYDGFNRLVSTRQGDTAATYTYDGDGLRQSKTVNGETTAHIWDGQNMVAEKAGGQTTNYIRSNRLVVSEKANVKTYYLYNVHGDVSLLTDSAKNILQSYQYDAFGNQKNPVETDLNPFRYCGEYYDVETGDIYLRARYYDSGVGRFNSMDPARSGINWYVYCSNNPVRFYDPSGLEEVMLKYAIEKNGGSVTYDGKTGRVDAYIPGAYGPVKLTYYVQNENVIDGRIIVDSADLAKVTGISENKFKHTMHDTFEREEDAAIAFGLMYNKKSIAQDREYGTTIHKRWSDDAESIVYGFGELYVGEPYDGNAGGRRSVVIEDTSGVAFVHTHARGSEYFSDGEYMGRRTKDIGVAYNTGRNAYVITPNGALKKFEVDKFDPSEVPVGQTEEKQVVGSLTLNQMPH